VVHPSRTTNIKNIFTDFFRIPSATVPPLKAAL